MTPPVKRRRWLRRLVWLLGFAVVLRIALGFALPIVLGKVAESNGFTMRLDDVSLSLLGGYVRIDRLALVPVGAPAGAPASVALEHAVVDVEMLALLTGRIVVRQMEVDGLDVRATRDAAGRITIDGLPPAAEAPPEPEPEAPTEPSTEFDLSLPAHVRMLRLQHVSLQIRNADDAAAPGAVQRFDVSVRVTDAGAPDAPTRIEVVATAPGMLDLLRVDGGGTLSARDADLRLALTMRGLDPATPGLEGIGCDADGPDVHAAATLRFTMQPIDGATDRVRARLTVDAVQLAAGERELVALDELAVELDPWTTRGPTVRRVEVLGVRAPVPDTPHRVELTALRATPVGDDGALTVEGELTVPGVLAALKVTGDARLDLDGQRVNANLAFTGDGLTLGALGEPIAAAGLPPLVDPSNFAFRVVADVATGDALRADVALTEFVVADANGARVRFASIGAQGVVVAGDTTKVAAVQIAGLDIALATGADAASLQLDATVSGLHLAGPNADPATLTPATLAATLRAAPFVDRLQIDGDVTTRLSPLDVGATWTVAATGIRGDALADRLREAGLTSTITDGRLAFGVRAQARAVDDGGMRIDAALTEFALTDGATPLLALPRAAVEGAVLREGGVRVASVIVEGPVTDVRRVDARTFEFLGLRTVLPEPPTEPVTPIPTDVAAVPADPTPATTPAPSPAARAAAAAAGTFAVEQFVWTGAAIRVFDGGGDAPLTTVRAQASIAGISDAADVAPARIDVTVAAEGSLDRATFAGTAQLDPDDQLIDVTCTIEGLRSGPLAEFLPPQLECSLTDGRLAFAARAAAGRAEAGGRRIDVRLTDLTLHDGDGPRLLGIREAVVAIPRLDPEGRRYEIDDVAVRGVEVRLGQRDDGAWELPGIALHPPSEPIAPPTEPDAEAPAAAPAVASVARPSDRLPRVVLNKFEIDLERIEWLRRDEAPVVLRLALTQPEPQTLLRGDPENLPPLRWKLTGAVPPVVDELAADVTIAVFTAQPTIDIAFAARGIRGPEVARSLAEFGVAIDGDGMTDGVFSAKLSALARLQRRSLTDFDLSRGFGVELRVDDVALRTAPDAEVAVGLEGILVDVQRIAPNTGDVHVKTIEIRKPRLRAEKSAEGFHVAGMTLRVAPAGAPTPPSEPPSEPTPAPAATVEATTPAPTPAPSDVPTPEFRVDDLVVSGLDVVYRDTSVSPTFVVPLTDLELEVRRFTTRMFTEHLPLRFHANLYAGGVELTKRAKSSGLIGGLLGKLVPLEGDLPPETRPLFDEIAVSGTLAFTPALEGSVDVEVISLELPAFRGLAASSGAAIGDGLLDQTVALRFLGDEGLTIDATSRFQHLSISEPADGPIASFLKLPAPLDQVLYLLRTPEAEHRIGIGVTVGRDGLSGGAIAGAVLASLSQAIGEAVLKSPLRVGSVFTDFVGVTGVAPKEPEVRLFAVPFEPATVVVSDVAATTIETIAARLRDDPTWVAVLQHGFGPDDLRLAETLGNPPPALAAEIATRLRAERVAIERRHTDAAAEARAHLATGRVEAAEQAKRRVAAAAHALADTEAALDLVYDLLRSGADRRRDSRARAMAIGIANRRIASLRSALIDRGVDAAQIESRRPRLDDPPSDATGRVDVVLRARPNR